MKRVIKNKGKIVKAYCLGTNGEVESRLTAEGKIRRREDGMYELFSQEAVNGAGELAKAGDYFKVDSEGMPYPNEKKWFEENHRHIEGDLYEQYPKPLDAWEAGDPVCDAMEFILKEGRLKLNPESEDRYFEAFLWGAVLTAKKDAVLVFYQIDRNEKGTIQDVSFNFVARKEFELTYHYITA